MKVTECGETCPRSLIDVDWPPNLPSKRLRLPTNGGDSPRPLFPLNCFRGL